MLELPPCSYVIVIGNSFGFNVNLRGEEVSPVKENYYPMNMLLKPLCETFF